jgi:putative toxin-antitoxin system antitoxin component (TIGR02293 family)
MNAIPDRIAQMFGGPEPLGRMPRTIDDWRELVQIGIPIAALANLQETIAPSSRQADTLADVVLETPDRRLLIIQAKYFKRAGVDGSQATSIPETEKLTSPESERAERIARLFVIAEEVLGREEEARDFLFSPHEKLDGHSPIDWMRTEIGGRNVEQILVNIREAFPS